MLRLYEFNNELVYYTNDNDCKLSSSIDFIIESQMIDYFNFDDKIKISHHYKVIYKKDLKIDIGIFGGISLYRKDNEFNLIILQILFCLSIFVSTISPPVGLIFLLSNKYIGIVSYCLSYLFINVICQSYGYYSSNKTLWLNIFVIVFLVGFLYFLGFVGLFELNFYHINDIIYLLVVGSLCYFTSGKVSIFVFRFLKYITTNEKLWLRYLCSFFCGQLIFAMLWFLFLNNEGSFHAQEYFYVFYSFKLKIFFSMLFIPFLYFFVSCLGKN